MTAGMLMLLALGATDPCAPVHPAARPDPASAALYRAVAEEEAAAGDRDAAAVAWRLAAENDPRDGRARDALAALCRQARAPRPVSDPLREAMRLFEADRFRDAAALLREARRAAPSRDAALLEGICRFELGEDAEAARLLREAETDPAHRETARLYLGMLALRGGAVREAVALLDAAAGNPALASVAEDLARAARWDGPFVASVLLEGGWDSNVPLTSTPLRPGLASNGDATGGISAVLVGRPFGANGLFLRAAGGLQQYSRLSEFDFRSGEVAAGLRWWSAGRGATVEYSLADRTLGGGPYLTTHRALVAAATPVGPISLSAAWWGRFERYAFPFHDFSGFAQRAEGRVSAALGPKARASLGWAWGRDDAEVAWLSWQEQGPRADLRLVVGARARLSVEAGYARRDYAAFDPDLGTTPWEMIFDAAAAFEWDVLRNATLRVSLSGRKADSNVGDYVYSKIVPSAAIGVIMSP